MKKMIVLLLGVLFINVSAQSISFTKVTQDTIVNDGGSSQKFAYLDFNNDGFQDVIIANYQAQQNGCYQNNGDDSFVRKGAELGDIATDAFWTLDIAVGDIDNDGNVDLFLPRNSDATHNFYQNTNGVFTGLDNSNVITNYPGYIGGDRPIFFDYNNDGWLDLFILGYQSGAPNYLYRNNKNGTFTRVYNELTDDYSNSARVALSDYDNDGDIDIFIANFNGYDNFFYESNGDSTYTQISNLNINTEMGDASFALFADLDNNGFDDLVVLESEQNGNVAIYYNNNGVFESATLGSFSLSQYPQTLTVGDYDNDGNLDIYIAYWSRQNQLYKNIGNRNFSLTTQMQEEGSVSQATWQDLNNDGFLDVFISIAWGGNNILFLNDANLNNNWIELRVKPMVGDTPSEGSILQLYYTDNTVPKIQKKLFERLNGKSNILHFGINQSTVIDSVVVHWKDGTTTKKSNLAINQILDIDQSTSPPPTSLDSNLVAYWNFDDGTATDSSGNGHNGTIHGTVPFTDGDMGKYVTFNGNYNNYIKVPHHADLNFTSSFSISFWVNELADGQVSEHLITKGRDISNNYRFTSSGRSFGLDFNTHSGGSGGANVNDTLFQKNVWNHVVGVCDEENMKVRYYLNGVLIVENDLTESVNLTTTYPLVFGRHFTSSSGGSSWPYPCNASLDEVRFYSRVLTEAEISLLYSEPVNLPVELTTFTATSTGSATVVLNWQTATEVNNYGFEIERQILKQVQNDDNNWEEIGFVNGHGNSNSPKDYSFVNSSVPLSSSVSYRLKQIDIDGSFEYSDVVTVELETPQQFKFSQNYPNPFNPTTMVSYSLPTDSKVKIEIFNTLGQSVALLVNGNKTAGYYESSWDAGNLPSGIYLISIKADGLNGNSNFSQVKKALLLK